MIDSKVKLYECLSIEKKLYASIGYKGKMHSFMTQCEVGKIYHYVVALRKDEYFSNTCRKNLLNRLFASYYRRQHNSIGNHLGIRIPINTFGKGLLIYHSQGIIVHKDVRCGDFCRLHGLNCLGNNGSGDGTNVPIIGNYLDLGVGAVVIGNVKLADHTTVAANAAVCKSYLSEYQVLAGIPAKLIKIAATNKSKEE